MSRDFSPLMGILFLLMCLFGLAFCGCAGVRPSEPGSNNCGMHVRSDFDTGGPTTLTAEILADRLDAALDAASLTTDYRLMYAENNCTMLVGYRVYTKPTRSFPDPWGRKWDNGNIKTIGGYTDCLNKIMVVGTPEDGNWNKSSLVHEMFHAMQGCETIRMFNPEHDIDWQHAGWYVDGIDDAITEAQKR